MRLCVHGSEHHLLLLLVMVVRLGLGRRCDRLRRFLPDSYTLLAMLAICRITSHIDIYLQGLITLASIMCHVKLSFHIFVD